MQNRIRELRKGKDLTMKELGKIVGLAESTISQYETGKRQPDNETLLKFAEFFGTTVDYILGGSDPSLHFSPFYAQTDAPIRIPVLGSVPAGIPIEAVEDIIDWEEIPASMARGGKEYFALRVSGDSMYPKYLEGDIVIVRRTPTCDSGDDCIVYVNGYDATLKTVLLGVDGSLTIRPLNANYPPRTFSKNEIVELPVSIAGVVAELRRKVKG